MKKLRGIIIIVICAALCLGYYYYLSNVTTSKDKVLAEAEQLINKDLDASYPTTPREVIKFYNRILVCLYSGETDTEKIEALGSQIRKLMDAELQEQNPEDMYLPNLYSDINDHKEKKEKIISVALSSSKDIERKTIDGQEYAYVESAYSIKGKKETERAQQTYILRKDEQGRWKILGYYQQ